MLEELWQRFAQHDRAALARLLTLAARGEQFAEVAASIPKPSKPCRVVAVTGSPGVGKSTLVGQLVEQIRSRGLTVGVLACDPESPLTGGALLGDRFRMGSSADDGVFIRSLAAPGGHGAVAERLDLLIRLLEVFGFDVIVIETVGAGQGDTAVRALADAVVLLVQPEAGDDLQFEKAGVLEIADVVVVHKADLPGAEQTAADLRGMLALTPHAAAPVLLVSSKHRQGMSELWEVIAGLPLRRGKERSRAELLAAVNEELARRLMEAERSRRPEVVGLLERWRRDELARETAATALLRFLELQAPR